MDNKIAQILCKIILYGIISKKAISRAEGSAGECELRCISRITILESRYEMPDNLEKTAIQWHPGFYSAAEIEFMSNKDQLEFEREYNLSKEPLRMDLLIIKKLADVSIENEIGHVFKTYNVIEYKSPDDSLTIDDYIKTVGYACLYKGMGKTVNQIPLQELTVSVFREAYPRELIDALQRDGFQVEKQFNGIYYVYGRCPFDSQIVVTSQLDKKTHLGLHVLSKHVKEADVRAFLEYVQKFTTPGDRSNIDAILQVSIAANQELYEQIRRDFGLCQALRELMKDEIAEEMMEARQKGLQEGLQEGRQETLLSAVKNLMENMKLTADQAMAVLNIPPADQAKYMEKI